MNVPNHAQSARIAADLRKLQNGQPIDAWTGNSYRGYTTTYDGHRPAYILRHWDTEIAAFTLVDGVVRVVVFRAHYYSSTTRGFQGRIAKAMTSAAVDPEGQAAISAELARSTGSRGRIAYDIALGAHSVIG